MGLKATFLAYARREMGIPLVGIAAPEPYGHDELAGIASVINSFSRVTSVPDHMKKLIQPYELLEGARSIIITGVPNYTEPPPDFTLCRAELRGTASAQHVTPALHERSKNRLSGICSFFTDRGFSCKALAGTLSFSAKIMASRCGVGFYGKNSMIIHPTYGSWLSLTGFVTDAALEPDGANRENCGVCDLCVRACPSGALHTPYRCDESRCINFHLGHNKADIPPDVRPLCANLIGQACRICRDVCPRNRGLEPIDGCMPDPDLLNPRLLDIVTMDHEQWRRTFAPTLLGLTMRSHVFLKRNAAIALGNFHDERAVPALSRLQISGDDTVKPYAAWALERIRSS